ncbi:hypothetical protein [Pseudomonas sp. MUP55]|uniref:hypothetical protein n=1 Tax=Pseudomonas sp. MUP55 TaxID=3087234 RepID=UPI002A5A072C|nr:MULTISPECIES: hypothetical protein [unclassified Pseudomonas]WPN95163.1 hypothetical protein SC319_12585 [Pseudomonas sp. MUP56]WPO00692.1 hypothetical protein SC318_12585 [Pseudomonas sp. MUP55]
MYQEVLDLFSSKGAMVAAISVLVGITLKSISILNQIMEFHDKHFIDKRYKILKELSSGIPVESKLKGYLEDSLELEVFRIVSGVRGSSKQIAALVKLDRLGYWNSEEIRRVSKFLVVNPEDSLPSVNITTVDKLSARLSLIMAILLLLLGGAISIVLTIKIPPYGFFIGLIPLTVMIWAGAYFAADYGTYRTALSIQKYLVAHQETFFAVQQSNDTQLPKNVPNELEKPV